MVEEWKIIEGYTNYEVSNLGNIRNIKKNKTMTIYYRKGYCLVKLSENNVSKEHKVHRLVAKAFIDNPNKYLCINHKDENKSNNRVDNLEWCNHTYNNNFGTRGQRQAIKIKKKVKQYDMHGNLIREFSSIKEASELLNIPACDISNCLHGRQKSAPKNLYVWKL